MTGTRRFPPPWSVDDIGGCSVVKASNNRPLVFNGETVSQGRAA
jgi:hypothetical protein